MDRVYQTFSMVQSRKKTEQNANVENQSNNDDFFTDYTKYLHAKSNKTI